MVVSRAVLIEDHVMTTCLTGGRERRPVLPKSGRRNLCKKKLTKEIGINDGKTFSKTSLLEVVETKGNICKNDFNFCQTQIKLRWIIIYSKKAVCFLNHKEKS